jgi:hypothetical protein
MRNLNGGSGTARRARQVERGTGGLVGLGAIARHQANK